MNLVYQRGKEIAKGRMNSLTDPSTEGTAEKIDTSPDCLYIALDGSTPVLHVADGGVRVYPIGESFIGTLLQPHHLEPAQLSRASNETAVSFFNDLLLAIDGCTVRLYIEDGEARAIEIGGPVED